MTTGLVKAIPITLFAGGAAAVADDRDYHKMDFNGTIWRVVMTVGTKGDTGGNTDVVVERTRSSSAADLWTVGSGCGRIAYNASNFYLTWDWENANWTGYDSDQLGPPSGTILKKGDEIVLNINAIPTGTTSTDVKVVLWVVPAAD